MPRAAVAARASSSAGSTEPIASATVLELVRQPVGRAHRAGTTDRDRGALLELVVGQQQQVVVEGERDRTPLGRRRPAVRAVHPSRHPALPGRRGWPVPASRTRRHCVVSRLPCATGPNSARGDGGRSPRLRYGSPRSGSHLRSNGLWLSLVEHVTGGHGVAGSNPVSPTDPDTRFLGVPDHSVRAHEQLLGRATRSRDPLVALLARSAADAGTTGHVGSCHSVGTLARGPLDLDYSHFTGQRRWTDRHLADAVASSRSWSEVASVLGLSGGSSTTTVRGHALRLGLDMSHLVRPPEPPAALAMMPRTARLARAGSLLAAAWFELCGCAVSWPLEPCRYDLLVWRGQKAVRVQVKTTTMRAGSSWVARLSSGRKELRTYDLTRSMSSSSSTGTTTTTSSPFASWAVSARSGLGLPVLPPAPGGAAAPQFHDVFG